MNAANAQGRVSFITLGCAKNEVDTADMKKKVLGAGFALEDDPASADAVVVNTCSFIQAATEESLEAIFDVAGLENFQRGDAKLIVAGCMPARYGDDLADELTEATEFVPCSKEDDIAAILRSILGAEERAEEEAETAARAADLGSQPSAYVKHLRRVRPLLQLLHHPVHPRPLPLVPAGRDHGGHRRAGGGRRARDRLRSRRTPVAGATTSTSPPRSRSSWPPPPRHTRTCGSASCTSSPKA